MEEIKEAGRLTRDDDDHARGQIDTEGKQKRQAVADEL